MTRDNSPPEAVRANGFRGSPGLGEIKNSARSAPVGPSAAGSSATRKRVCSIARAASSASTAS